ncbi:MAG: ABC transporter permease, partial [Pseudomonadota bacterium]
MLGFVCRRVLATIPVLAMVALIVFLMLRLTRG